MNRKIFSLFIVTPPLCLLICYTYYIVIDREEYIIYTEVGDDMKIDFNNAKAEQSLFGWGTSACWWSQYCTGDAADEIARLLYSDDGLGLNIYRYNIGGGTDDNNCRISNPWRKTESMLLYDRENEEFSWDYSRDKNAVDMMKKCLSYGKVDTLILFCNSPHYSQCSTGQASGSLLYHTCNIPASKYKAFADYVLDVAEHFLAEGLPVKYISPINEPQWKWGGTSVWQEGCHYETEEMVAVFRIFAEKIIKRGLPLKLYGPESGEYLGLTEEYLDALYSDKTIMKVLDVFAVHSYHCDNEPSVRREFRKKIRNKYSDIRMDMSEWCELPNMSPVDDFTGALITARIIGQDLTVAGMDSWTSWVAVNNFAVKDSKDYSDGVITADFDFSDWAVAMRWYGFAHFSRYVPVGSTVLNIGMKPTDDNNLTNAFAFLTPDSKTVLVAVNEGENTEITLNGNFSHMKKIISDGERLLKEDYDGDFKQSIILNKNSIITVILS